MTEAVAWYTCHVAGRVQLTSSSQETDTVTVWAVRAGTIVKVTSLALPGRVRDRDLRMLSVYETTLISVAVPSLGEVHLYTLKNDTVTWNHVDSGGINSPAPSMPPCPPPPCAAMSCTCSIAWITSASRPST